MSQQSLELVQLLASLAGSFLLALLFVGLVAACVLLWLGGRGIKIARDNVASLAKQILDYTVSVEAKTKVETQAIIQPQIEAASMLAGVQAGTRALLRGAETNVEARSEPSMPVDSPGGDSEPPNSAPELR